MLWIMNAAMNGKKKLESGGDKQKKEFINIKSFWDASNKKPKWKTYVNIKERNNKKSSSTSYSMYFVLFLLLPIEMRCDADTIWMMMKNHKNTCR